MLLKKVKAIQVGQVFSLELVKARASPSFLIVTASGLDGFQAFLDIHLCTANYQLITISSFST